MEQILKVRTDEIDGDEGGNEWTLHYVLYQTVDDDGLKCFDLYEDDGAGNGVHVCRSYHLRSIRHATLKLGEFVEWQQQKAA